MAISSVRLTGLYSNMDTDSIVESLMKIEQLKVDREFRTKVSLQWKQEALNSVKSDIEDFKNKFISVLSSSSMYSANAYNVFDVAMSGSDTSAVTIKAGGGATVGSHVINQVDQVAAAASSTSAAKVSNGDQLSATNSTMLKDLDFKTPMAFDGDGNIKFTINGESFTFNQNDTLTKVLNTVNSSDKAGVTLGYSRLTDKFTIASEKTGASSEIVISNEAGNAFGAGGAFGIGTGTIQDGRQDAIVKIDGITVQRSSNTFSIDGITYTLNKQTAADANIGFTLTQNVDKAVDKIKGFVEAYNTLVAKLDSLISERKRNDEANYRPLTDTEKDAMTDEEIEKWEAIAKKGQLYNDGAIKSMMDNLRKTLFTAVSDAGLSPAQIGIKTGEWQKKGQIALDETKLRSALEKDPQQVMTIFTSISSSTDASTKYKENGLLARISNIMDSYTKNSKSSITLLNKNIEDAIEKVDELEEKMVDIQAKYYAKYAAMETALSKMESQSKWMSSMLGTA